MKSKYNELVWGSEHSVIYGVPDCIECDQNSFLNLPYRPLVRLEDK